jgi:tetratricopeptide (TPR) repeat protein
MKSRHTATRLLLLAALLPGTSITAFAGGQGTANWVGYSMKGTPCTGKDPHNFGPYDYTKTDHSQFSVVHKAHFSSDVEYLRGGKAGINASGGIDYTLTVIPNHHRALNSAIKLQLRNKAGDMSDSPRSPAECYLQRAIAYSPDDATAYMLYGMLMHRYERYEESLKLYQRALELSPGSANLDYNYALLLTDMERYGEARKIADKLYSAGFPLPGLKNRLSAAGEWP